MLGTAMKFSGESDHPRRNAAPIRPCFELITIAWNAAIAEWLLENMKLKTTESNSPKGNHRQNGNPSAQAACTSDLEVQNSCTDNRNSIINETEVKQKQNIFSMKSTTRLGTWNVRTLYEVGKLHQAARELRKFRLEVLGMSECRWNGSGEHQLATGEKFLYSGRAEGEIHSEGVGFLLSKNASRSLIEWNPVSERIIYAKFHSRVRNIAIIQVYAPTELADTEVKEEFYDQLTAVLADIKKGNILILMGDFNAKVGSDNLNLEHVMGKQGLGDINENGELFVEACVTAELVIGGTLFIHKKCHKTTWISPDGRTENQIDHFCISRKWRGSLLDVRVRRSADIGSDHQLLIADVRLKVAAVTQDNTNQAPARYDVSKLKDAQCRAAFVDEMNLASARITNSEPEDVEASWVVAKSIIIQASEKVLGNRPKEKKEWMSEQTWALVEERRCAKRAKENARTRAHKQSTATVYSSLNRDVKKSCRRDKRSWYDNLALHAETAAETKDLKVLYDTSRKLAGRKFQQNHPVKSKDGVLITSKEKQLERWHEHFNELLSAGATSPNEAATSSNLTENQRESGINSQAPSIQEITSAINAMKNHKSPGYDQICAEMLKASPELTAKILYPVFSAIWESEHLPSDWLEGILIKIPKKGSLSLCNNYRGITLLSIPSKVLAKVLLCRINEKLDNTLRKQQAGFRANRSCVDQINTIRIIVEQVNEWQTSLQLCFVDYSTAFDSLSRLHIWDSLKNRGIPPKLINLIRAQYNGFKCRVLHNGLLSEPINTVAGVRQGCLLSPILFLIVLDDILGTAIDGIDRGICWKFDEQLGDLDFADDICLLATKHSDMQNKLQDLKAESEKCGLKINIKKTKAMKINSTADSNFKIGTEDIELVENFTYLGSVITPDGGAKEDILARINKAKGAFAQLHNIWNSSILSLNTKIKIFNSNVKSVLLYGCETWLVTEVLTNKIQSFVNRCLRRILKIWWPNTISNIELHRRTNQQPIATEISIRKWGWIGHTFRKDPDEVCRQALDWNPQGNRKRGRPKVTWKRTVLKEVENCGKTWSETKRIARDRSKWRCFTKALCSTRNNRN